MADAIVVKGVTARRLREEAGKLGLSLDEYLLELLTQNLDPRDRAKEYVNALYDLLAEAREELEKGNIRQAAEKTWGAAALAVKAYALWKDGKHLVSHKELWEYKSIIANELGSWVLDAWAHANSMHACFYEGWCTREDVEAALTRVGKLVEEVKQKIKGIV
ncbi:MAG: hypothetical protein DRJ64_10895 [Thermoprotei archaeon]|nr:MAG: hypothetical protein DRJ64_10895 [Thermoprotei archaeon]